MRLTLYSWWRSSCSHRVRIALALKELEYEYVSVRIPAAEGPAGEAHRARSPTGYVPCLVVDDVAYVESVAIIELLEERFPRPPLYPGDAHARARIRALVEIVNSGIQPLQNTSIQAEVVRATGDGEAAPRWAKTLVARGLGALERAMEGNAREGVTGPYAYGTTPTAADAFLVPQVVSAKRFRVPLEPYARVSAAYEEASRLDAFRRAAPENQVDADAVKSAG
ncbi:MAG TPA: maleylacetoacetate isomerase [Polyangiaceae bacterium]|jgi:maleylpyruvate isomerase|nr:maleylacetoacetate isomerase [Polyangiaceae bacterium]